MKSSDLLLGVVSQSSHYVCIVGGVLDIGGHDESLVGPISFISAIEGVPDIDAVVKGCYITVGTFTRRGLSRLPRHWEVGLGF